MLTNAKLDDNGWTLYATQFAENPQQGVYVGLWNFSNMIERGTVLDFYPGHGEVSSYGVCDSPEQGIEANRWFLNQEDRYFCIAFNPIRKKDQPKEGGWRWHKWGAYIGNQQREGYEYLYDEPHIEEVYVYEIIELKPPTEEIPLLPDVERPRHLYHFITDDVRPNFKPKELEGMRVEAEEWDRRVEEALAAKRDEVDTNGLKYC